MAELPLNMRFKIIHPDDLAGMPVLMCAIPSDPARPEKMNQVPCRMEIQLIDPENGEPTWYEIPFENLPPPSVIEIRPRGRRQ